MGLNGWSVVAALLLAGIVTNGAEFDSNTETAIAMDDRRTLEPSTTESFGTSDSNGFISLQDFAGPSDYASEFERSLAFDKLLLLVDTKQLTQLLAESSSIEPHSIQVALRESLIRRFAMLDPVTALDLVAEMPQHQQRRMNGAIFQEWASVDLDAMIEYLVAQRPTSLRSVAFEAIVKIREDLSDTEKTSKAREFGLEQFITEAAIYKSEWDSERSIESIWHKVTKQHGGRSTNSLTELSLLGQKWIDTEGLQALAKVNELTDNWRLRREILRRLVSHAGQSDPKATFEYALKLFRDTDWPLVEQAAGHWVRREPKKALRAIAELDPNRLHTELYSAAIEDWASVEPRTVLENLDEFPEDLRHDALLTALSNVTDWTSQEVSQLVSELDVLDRYPATLAILECWKEYAFDDAFDWVVSNSPADRSEPKGLGTVLKNLSALDAEIAFGKALELPPDQNGIGLEADVLAYIAETNFDEARDRLKLVRNEQTKFEATAKMGRRLLMWLQDEWDSAIQLASEIPIAARKDYFKRIEPGISFFRGEITEHIERHSNPESQSKFALSAMIYGMSTTMSDAQLARLRFYLSTEDLERIERVEALLTP